MNLIACGLSATNAIEGRYSYRKEDRQILIRNIISRVRANQALATHIALSVIAIMRP
jgi:hypothetical protein